MKRLSTILGLLILVTAGTVSIAPVQASFPTRSDATHMRVLRTKEKWLLPSVQLPNDVAEHVLDFGRKLRMFTSGEIARDINKVEFNLQATPQAQAVDALKNKNQASALVELGMLTSMGHFAVLNARNATIRAGAVSIINQLADVADHNKMGNLASQYQRLATDVGDPKFLGGPSPITARYDATVSSQYDWVATSYGVDGHWFFMYGNAIAGLYALSAGGDQFHSEYYLCVLHDLYHKKPSFYPDYLTRYTLTVLINEPARDSKFLAGETWSIIDHYVTGNNWYANPRSHHFDMNGHPTEVP